MKNLLILIISSFTLCCCSPKNDSPNIRTQPGIEFCGPACNKMDKLYKDGDESCSIYIEEVVIDGGKLSCKEFCEYEMSNSVQLNPKCIYEEINSCTEIPDKCED